MFDSKNNPPSNDNEGWKDRVASSTAVNDSPSKPVDNECEGERKAHDELTRRYAIVWREFRPPFVFQVVSLVVP